MTLKVKNKIYTSNGKEYLKALLLNPTYCKLIHSPEKEYLKLLNWLIEKEKDVIDDNSIPALRDVSKIIGVRHETLVEKLKQIYDDILKLNATEPIHFCNKNEKFCRLFINSLGTYAYFNLSLIQIPRINESFTLPFIQPKVGFSHFYVKNVGHEIVDGKQIITVDLIAERPNSYLQLLCEKAVLKDELSWVEYEFGLKDETKEFILKNNQSL